SRRPGWRRKAPTMTLSRIVISSKVAGTWKVRPMPSRACASGEARVTSVPSKRTRPPVGWRSPERQLKKVDLPAPFGPMRPTISPASSVSSAPDRARKLPKARETWRASSSMDASRLAEDLAQLGRRQAIPQRQQPARLEAAEQQDDAAIDDVGEARDAAAEPGIGRRLQGHQDDRAEQRPEEPSGAAQRRRDEDRKSTRLNSSH